MNSIVICVPNGPFYAENTSVGRFRKSFEGIKYICNYIPIFVPSNERNIVQVSW